MKNKFWFIWNPSGNIPRYKHESFESAKEEAKRLALKMPGIEFVVLESLGSVVKNEVIWKGHGNEFHEEDIPF